MTHETMCLLLGSTGDAEKQFVCMECGQQCSIEEYVWHEARPIGTETMCEHIHICPTHGPTEAIEEDTLTDAVRLMNGSLKGVIQRRHLIALVNEMELFAAQLTHVTGVSMTDAQRVIEREPQIADAMRRKLAEMDAAPRKGVASEQPVAEVA